jgi:OPA family glycerol-3-phosphate transporter-like MFS transporter
LLLQEFGDRGLDKTALGIVVSSGVLSYAVGKLFMGVLGDFVGGRRMFIVGMIASAAATVAFGMSGALVAFASIWVVNRFVQSMGWGAVVKIAAHWYEPRHYGRVMAVLSLSFLFGDAVGRYLLGMLVNLGYGWRAVFFSAAASLAVLAVGATLLLRDSPRDLGLPLPGVNSRNVYGREGGESAPCSMRDLLRPYLTSASFWLVCVVSFALTAIRETFNGWTPTYLVEMYRLADGDAAQKSALFPFVGGVSVLLVGSLSDRMPSVRLGLAMPFLGLGVLALAALGSDVARSHEAIGLGLMSAVALLVIGPYSLLAGAIAVDLGGRRGSATAAGLIDTAGYVGAILSGYAVGTIAQRGGWDTVFRWLAIVGAVAVAAAGLSWYRARRATLANVELPA